MYVLLFHDSRLMAKPVYRKGREEQFWVFSTWYLAFIGDPSAFRLKATDGEPTAKYQVPITFSLCALRVLCGETVLLTADG
jgi:hypothetical protein